MFLLVLLLMGCVFIVPHFVFQMPPDLEAHGRRLAHCLAGLRDQADKLHMPQWLEAVAEASSSLIPGT